MPNFWSARMDFPDIGESFLVKARPKGLRGDEWLSWIPFRTGDEFIAEVEVTRICGTRSVDVACYVTEPGDTVPQLIMGEYDQSVPFEGSTSQRFLAKTGEYIFEVNLWVIDPAGGPRLGPFNRRLVSLYTFSQDAFVGNLTVALVGGGVGVVGGILLSLIF